MTQSNTKTLAKPANPGVTQDKTELVRLIPMGGLGEIGKNMMLIEYGDNILIVDAGLMFPDSEMYGVDVIIPDMEYLLERLEDVKAIILTHGHEDHIGGLPYLVEQGLSAPVYGTSLTLGLLEVKLKEQKLQDEVTLHTITEEDRVEIGPFVVEFFHTCHSFPDSVGLSIQTPVGRIIHTSDYKFDPSPVDGKLTEEDKLSKWGDEGVLVLLADSTNSEVPGRTPSEKNIEITLDRIFGEAKGRVILATFASNIGRVGQIVQAARRHGRRVGVTGRSMVNNVRIAMRLGYLDTTPEELLSVAEMEELADEQVVIVATGSQGEPTSAMVRMSVGDHRQITLRPTDTVVVSASPIPGNEELFNRTIDNLFRRGANVIYHAVADIHVSGHGGQEDYLHMLNLVRPTYFIPVHGEYRHLVLNKRLGMQADIPEENIFVLEDGQSLEFGRFDPNNREHIQPRYGETVSAHHVFVDGLGVGDVGSVVLRDRGHLAQDGFMVCIVALDEYTGEIVFGPQILSRGFVYMRESEDLIRRAEEVVERALRKSGREAALQHKIKDVLSSFCYQEMRRRPMILPLVMEV